MSTPFDQDALDFLIDLGMRRVKIPSGEITNLPFLKYVASKNLPIILSTGMSTLDEVIEAVSCIRNERLSLGYDDELSKYLTILHCTSNYPAVYSDVNLRAMNTIANSVNLPVGYSDHTLGSDASLVAVSMGATIIEKHFTLDKGLPGPDHQASLMPDELIDLVRRIILVEDILGSAIKQPTISEIPVMNIARRSVALSINAPKGHVIKESDIILLRPGNGIEPKNLKLLIGRQLAKSMMSGDTLLWSDLLPVNK
jgi:N,N'-diacetyllegionaminate synthase